MAFRSAMTCLLVVALSSWVEYADAKRGQIVTCSG
jgi:hypothetical protein